MAYPWESPINRERFQDRLARALRDVQMAYGDYAICWREAESLVDLEDVAGAVAQSISVLLDGQEQCRIRIADMKGSHDAV